MAENENGNTQYVERSSGWSSFWRWVGMIVVVLILAMVVIYVANTFLLGQSMNQQSQNGDGATIELHVGDGEGEGGGDAGGEASNNGG